MSAASVWLDNVATQGKRSDLGTTLGGAEGSAKPYQSSTLFVPQELGTASPTSRSSIKAMCLES